MLVSLSFALLATAASATPCESLRSLAIPQTTMVTADLVPAGIFVQPALPVQPGGRGNARRGGPPPPPAQPIPRHCRVTMVLKPT